MGVFDRGIRGNIQSPFTALGDAGTVGYSNPRLPSGWSGNVQTSLDYIIDALYPNYKGTVQTKANLPTVADANDYYIVSDDGDGKSAGYVYSVLQGSGQWIKRYDVDYSAEGILAEAITRTQYMYVSKYGAEDRDAGGVPVSGQQAGQTVYGGLKTNQNLSLFANAADQTGTINIANSIEPLSNAIDLGSTATPLANLYLSTKAMIGPLLISGTQINSGSTPLNLEGTSVNVRGPMTIRDGAVVGSSLSLAAGQITDQSSQIAFGGNTLNGINGLFCDSLHAATSGSIGNFSFSGAVFTNSAGTIDFGNNALTNIASLAINKLTTTEVDIGALKIVDSAVTTTANYLKLQAALGLQVVGGASVSLNFGVTGNTTLSGTVYAGSTLQVSDAVKLSTVNGDARLESLQQDLVLASTGKVKFASQAQPSVDATQDLGSTTARFKVGYFSQGFSDGTNTVPLTALTSLRDINTGATAGMSLFYNGSEWLPSAPDTEIVHSSLSGLTTGDAGHTQFALLAGRAGGQSLLGGLASGENLTLDSTANATKGLVLTSSTFAPTTDSAQDLGTSVRQFKDVYTSGISRGLRFDQYAGSANYPANTAAKIGRVIWDTSANQLLVDNGATWSKVGNQKFLADLTFDGTMTSQSVTVSGSISDARSAVWQLLDNTNGFEQIYVKMTKTQTSVTITSSPALPSGSYRLVGFN